MQHHADAVAERNSMEGVVLIVVIISSMMLMLLLSAAAWRVLC